MHLFDTNRAMEEVSEGEGLRTVEPTTLSWTSYPIPLTHYFLVNRSATITYYVI